MLIETNELDETTAYSFVTSGVQITKLDANGSELSSNLVAVDNISDYKGIQPVTDGYFIYGYDNNEVYLIKVNLDFELDWETTYILPDEINANFNKTWQLKFESSSSTVFVSYIVEDAVHIASIKNDVDIDNLVIQLPGNDYFAELSTNNNNLYVWTGKKEQPESSVYVINSSMQIINEIDNILADAVLAYDDGVIYLDGSTATALNPLGDLNWALETSAIEMVGASNNLYFVDSANQHMITAVSQQGQTLWQFAPKSAQDIAIRETESNTIITNTVENCSTRINPFGKGEICTTYVAHYIMNDNGAVNRKVVEDIAKIYHGVAIEPTIPYSIVEEFGVVSASDVDLLSNGDLISFGSYTEASSIGTTRGVISTY